MKGMPWKVVTRYGKNMSLKEVVNGIFSRQESEAKENERKEGEQEEIERKCKEYYETHMKKETDRLNSLLDWFKLKLDKISPVDDRPRMLERLYRISEKNKHLGVTIIRARTLNPVNYPKYPPELKLHEYEDNEENPFYDATTASSLPAGCKLYNQLNYFKKIIRDYQGRDENAVKYVKKVKELIDK